jgi:hypothetical protein
MPSRLRALARSAPTRSADRLYVRRHDTSCPCTAPPAESAIRIALFRVGRGPSHTGGARLALL